MGKIINAPTRARWHLYKEMRHIPILGSIMKKKDIKNALILARRISMQERKFVVKDFGWARKKATFNAEQVRRRLIEIDQIMDFRLLNFPQSQHFSRVYEFPYAVYQLQSLKGKVLDVGGNLTSLQFYLEEQGFEVYSLDPDLYALRQLSKLKPRLKSHLKLAFGELLNLPFADEYFDGIVCISVLEHAIIGSETAIYLKGCINELLRTLKPNGVLILTFDVSFGETGKLTLEDYGELCKILGIKQNPLPSDRIFSSDTAEGLSMGRDLAVYSVTLVKQ
jgi:SAM-dependent methyltransferase